MVKVERLQKNECVSREYIQEKNDKEAAKMYCMRQACKIFYCTSLISVVLDMSFYFFLYVFIFYIFLPTFNKSWTNVNRSFFLYQLKGGYQWSFDLCLQCFLLPLRCFLLFIHFSLLRNWLINFLFQFFEDDENNDYKQWSINIPLWNSSKTLHKLKL